MRVCFDTLCFSSRLRAADEEAPPGLDSPTRPDHHHHPPIIIMSESNPNQQPSVEELRILIKMKDERIEFLEELVSRRADEVVDLLKDEKIRQLEAKLKKMEEEVVDLRSHLDKFQSVFPFHVNNARLNAAVNLADVVARPRKQRTGISAEPQSEASLQELARTTFRTYEKNER